MISAFDFLLLAVASWRLAHMVTNEDGPFGVFDAARQWPYPFGTKVDAKGVYHDGVLTCLYCCSVWTAAVGALLFGLPLMEWALVSLAASGAGLMLGKLTRASFEEGA